MSDRALTVREVAERYGVTTPTVNGWIKKGALKAHRLPGGHWRILPDAIAEFDRKCLDRNSPAPITGCDGAADPTSSPGPTKPPGRLDPFRRGRLMSVPHKSGATNG
jgi:excisionase family DNA binding protein